MSDPVVLCPGPVEGVSYPLNVQYCGECSLPLEYCANGGCPDRCRKWLEDNLPEMASSLGLGDGGGGGGEGKEDGGEEEKKRQKRGGRGAVKPPKAKAAAAAKVTLQRAPRGKNKSVTVIKGLGSAGLDVKVAAKFFAGRFACGSSVTATDEIVIQGDCKDELFDLIPEKWPQIDEDIIEDLGDLKR